MQAKDHVPFAAPLFAALAGLFLWGSAASAQSPSPPRKLVVADVLVSGNERTPTQTLMSYIRTRANAEYSEETVREDVRNLLASRRVGNVQVRLKELGENKVTVHFLVVDFPSTIQEIVYLGAKKFKTDELNTITGLKKGDPLNPVVNQIACQAIVRRYQEKGRPFASCTLLEGNKVGDARVVFNIIEGPQVYVRAIEFVGNKWMSGPVLKTHLVSSEKFLGLKFFSKPYIPAMADADVQKLVEYYRSHGFHDVRVSRETRWDPDGTHVTLVYHIHEGIRYRVKDAPQVVGVKAFRPAELERLSDVRKGDYYSQGKIDKDVVRIKDYIGATGRQAAVQDRVFFTGPGEVTVHYEVQERPPAKVGQIFIIGNNVTRQNVILREVPLYPGQPLSYPAIREGERNLARTQLFEVNPETGIRPTISVIDPDSDSEFKDILINVQESRTGSLLFGVGFNSDAGATGSIVLNERNFDITRFPTSWSDLLSGQAFRGAGQELRLEAIPGTELQRYTFSFRDPYLFDSRFSLSVGGYYYTRIFDEYTERREGGRISLGRRLNDLWTASTTVRIENVHVGSVPFFAPPDYTSVQGNNFQVGVRGGLTRDSRDSYLRPTEGSLLDVSYEQIFGDRSFPLVSVDFNKYFTVFERADGSGRHVLAARSQVAWAGDNTPVYERYFAGGFRSIRGFSFRGVGPDVNGFKVGGQFLFLNSLEYQIPVKADDSIYFVGFIDSGTVERTASLRDYRVSAGVGVRFTVPMLGPVPIALDFGFPLVKADRDHEQIFSFWLGFFR